MRTPFTPLLVLFALSQAACTPTAPASAAPTIETATFASSLGITLSAFTKTASGLYYQDSPAGTGATAASGQAVSTRYTGYYTSGTSFDSNVGNGKPLLQFTIGAGQVIAGMEEGVTGMKVNGTRKLIIPPALGYGGGSYQGIPPNSILVFTVQLVSIP